MASKRKQKTKSIGRRRKPTTCRIPLTEGVAFHGPTLSLKDAEPLTAQQVFARSRKKT